MTEEDKGQGKSGTAPRTVTARSELVGRGEEMELLLERLDEARESEGGTILIEGEAGIGKTRLVKEFTDRARKRDVQVLTGNCIEGGTPYLPFLNALSGLMDRAITEHVTGIKEAFIVHVDGRLIVHNTIEDVSSIDDDVMSSTLTAIRDFIGHSFRPSEKGDLKEVHFGRHKIVMEQGKWVYVIAVADPAYTEGLHPQIRRVVADFEQEFGDLLEGWRGELSDELMASKALLVDLMEGRYAAIDDPGATETPSRDGERGRLFDSIASMVTEMANRDPVVLFFDDLQWMDRSSLDLLHYLARVAIDEPILIIGAYRPEDLTDNMNPDATHDLVKTIRKLNREGLFTLLRIKRLDKEENRRMIDSIFPKNIFTYGLPDRVFDGSQGNPLFTEEVLRELVESKVIFEEKNGWRNTRIEDIVLPSTIKDVVLRRLGRLGERETELIQYGAVAGNEFEYEVVQRALGWDETEVVEILDDLVKLRVLNESLGEDSYSFDHTTVREVILQSMSRLVRRRIHEKVARSMMEIHQDELEKVCFDLANQFSRTRDRENTVRFNIMAGKKAMRTSATADAVKFFEVALANLEPDVQKGSETARKRQMEVFYELGRCRSILGDGELALSYYGKALDEAGGLGEKERMAWSHLRVAEEYYHRSEWDESMENFRKALGLFDEMGIRKGEAEVHRGMGRLFWRQGEYEMAIQHLEFGSRIFSEMGMRKSMGSVIVDMGNVLVTKGDLEESLERYEEGLNILEDTGDKLELSRVHNNLGVYYMDNTDDYDRSLHHHVKSLEMAKEVKDLRGEGYSLFGIGTVNKEMDNLEKAEEYMDEAYGLFRKMEDDYMIGSIHGERGLISKKRGDRERALKEFEEAERIYRRKNLRFELAELLSWKGGVYMDLGSEEEGQEVLSEALSIAEDIGAMNIVTDVLKKMEN